MIKKVRDFSNLFKSVKFENNAPLICLNGKENRTYNIMLKDFDFIENNLTITDLDQTSPQKLDKKLENLLLKYNEIIEKKRTNNKYYATASIKNNHSENNLLLSKMNSISLNKNNYFKVEEKKIPEIPYKNPKSCSPHFNLKSGFKKIKKYPSQINITPLSSIQRNNSLKIKDNMTINSNKRIKMGINSDSIRDVLIDFISLPLSEINSNLKIKDTLETAKNTFYNSKLLNSKSDTKGRIFINNNNSNSNKERFMKSSQSLFKNVLDKKENIKGKTLFSPQTSFYKKSFSCDRKTFEEMNNTINETANKIVNENIVEKYGLQNIQNENIRNNIFIKDIKKIKKKKNSLIDFKEKRKMIQNIKKSNFHAASLSKIRKTPYSFFSTVLKKDKFLSELRKFNRNPVTINITKNSKNIIKDQLENVYNYFTPIELKVYKYLDEFQIIENKIKYNKVKIPKNTEIKKSKSDNNFFNNNEFSNEKNSHSNIIYNPIIKDKLDIIKIKSHLNNKKNFYEICENQINENSKNIENHTKKIDKIDEKMRISFKKCFYDYISGNVDKDIINYYKNKHGQFIFGHDFGHFYDNSQRLFNSSIDNSKKKSIKMKSKKIQNKNII